MYKCDRCGEKFDDAYNRTLYFNGAPVIETLCKACIERIGRENATTDNDSDMPDGNSSSDNREDATEEVSDAERYEE